MRMQSARTLRFLLPLFALLLVAACSLRMAVPEPGVREVLAPSGKLRVGLYPGTPTSYLAGAGNSAARGVGFELGRAVAEELGVLFEPVVLKNNAEVLAAAKSGQVDLIFTNATAERRNDLDFSPICLEIELGYLTGPQSPIKSLADVDRTNMRIGVTARSSSQGVLTRDLKLARVVPAATVGDGAKMLAAGEIDAYATNKPTLFEMGDTIPGARVLEGRWGEERMALGLPKGREAGHAFLARFVAAARSNGLIATAIARAGLRGAI